jgi:hypothetical protein
MRVYQFRHVGITKDSDYSRIRPEVNSLQRYGIFESVVYLANFLLLRYTNFYTTN